MLSWASEEAAWSSATSCRKSSRVVPWPGRTLWSTKSGAIISSSAARSFSHCAWTKRRTRALFCSSSDLTGAFLSCQLTFPQRRDTVHDATQRSLACCLAAYSPECVEVEFLEVGLPLYGDPRRSP